MESLIPMRVLVTGGNGFIGRSIVSRLIAEGAFVRGSVRTVESTSITGGEFVGVGDLNAETNWTEALVGINVVIHTAARVHEMRDRVAEPLLEFRRVNVEGSLQLARQAVEAGVSRFIYISSIKVNGEETFPGTPFKASDKPNPTDPYAISKFEAEEGLKKITKESGMEVVIIRPPLVYGPGVKANFQNMMRWIDRGTPLPLGAIHNKRSFVALDNLVDLIVTCIEHLGAANQTFLAGDGEDLSTTELLQRVAGALGKSARLIPISASMLVFVASLLGKKDLAQRLCGSLQVDISRTRALLGWEPPVSLDECLRQVAEEYIK